MTGPFDELVGRLTDRLRVDPELQLEVAKELRAHLEDATADYRASGLDDEKARAEAVKALGDETEIADKLWQANYRRLRLRKAARWAFGITIGPAAAVVTIAVGWGAVASLLVAIAAANMLSRNGSGDLSGVFESAHQQILDSVAPSARLVIDVPNESTARIEWAAALVKQSSGDAIYQANYVRQLLTQPELLTQPDLQDQAGKSAVNDHAALGRVLEACRRGQEIEPGNAFYPLVAASVLFENSAKDLSAGDNPRPPISFSYAEPWVDGPPKTNSFDLDQLNVTDPAMFKQGTDALSQAARCTYLESHTRDLLNRQMSLWPPPQRYGDALMAPVFECTTLLPQLNGYRLAINWSCWAAWQAATDGRREEAFKTLDDAKRVSLLASRHSDFLIGLMVVSGMYEQTLGARVLVNDALHLPKDADAAKASYLDYRRFFYSTRNGDSDDGKLAKLIKLHGDCLDAILVPAKSHITDAMLAPGRGAEYALVDRLELTQLVGLLLVMAALKAASAIPRRGRRPAMMFIGWRRLGLITLAAIAPVAAYAIYLSLPTLSGRSFSAEVSTDRLAVEYAAVFALVLTIIGILNGRALRARAAEIGFDQIALPRLRPLAIITGLILGAAVIGELVAWHWTVATPLQRDGLYLPTGYWGFALVPLLLVFGLTRQITKIWFCLGMCVLIAAAASLITAGLSEPFWLALVAIFTVAVISAFAAIGVWRWWSGALRQKMGQFSFGLSSAPALMVAALVLACVGGPLAGAQEKCAVTQMSQPGGSYDLLHEIDYSPWGALQKHLSDQL
jgi:hypothetical protein